MCPQTPDQGILETPERLEATHKKQRDRYAADTPFVSARTEVEERLSQIWVEVLDLDKVGVHDNFFDFDGDSLLAMQIAGRVRERMAVVIRMRTIFDAPTIAELAEQIVQAAT